MTRKVMQRQFERGRHAAAVFAGYLLPVSSDLGSLFSNKNNNYYW